MNAEIPKKPPNARGQGRKSLSGGGQSPLLRVRVSDDQLEKVERLGGPAWVRRAIDEASDADEDGGSITASQVADKAVSEALGKLEKAISKVFEKARAKP